MRIAVDEATEVDAAAIALVRSRAAEELTRLYGRGQWSWLSTEQAALRDVQTTRVLVARDDGVVVGTLKLQTQKPWAIDAAYFTPVSRPLYLLDMAVDPVVQRRGVGRALLEAARDVASASAAEAIRLDAYDAAAGAAEFYEKCGYREVGRATYRDNPLIYFERLLVEK